MDLDQLLQPFPVKKEAELVAKTMAKHPETVEKLWAICTSNQKHSWRAAWLFEKLYKIAPDLVRPYIPKMIALIPELKNEGKLREFLRLICCEPLPEDVSGAFINRCFDLLQSPATPIAIRVHALQVLYIFSLKEPDIQNELVLIINEQMQHGSAGFRNRAKKILAKINR